MSFEPVSLAQRGRDFLVGRARDEQVRHLHDQRHEIETDEQAEDEEDVLRDLRVLLLDRRQRLGPRQEVSIALKSRDTVVDFIRFVRLPGGDVRPEAGDRLLVFRSRAVQSRLVRCSPVARSSGTSARSREDACVSTTVRRLRSRSGG
jgi:hypothetical protein